MPYLAIDNFQNGLDARKSPLTTPAGSLMKLTNATITPGGEIAKRRAFVKVADLKGTRGLATVGNKVVVFHDGNTPLKPDDLQMENNYLEYHALPGLSPTARMIDHELFDGKIYTTWYDKTPTGTVTPAKQNPHYYNDKKQDAAADDYKLTEGSGKGYYIRAFQSKMYCVSGNYMWFSALKYPMLWEEAATLPPSGAYPVSVLPIQGVANERVIIASKKKIYTWTEPPATATGAAAVAKWVESTPDAADLTWIDQHSQRTGSGYINVALSESGGHGLQGIEIYYNQIAIMSDETTQIWSVDPDANQNAISQVIRNNGTRAPLSIKGFGTGDVLYLSSSGIRSLKARDASNSAAVTDIGSPVDNLIREIRNTRGELYLMNAAAVTEPVTGRFWMCFPDAIFALAYFPGPKISAWAKYTFPFQIDYIVPSGDYIFVRAGDDLYVYGGRDGQDYDECAPDGVIVESPYYDCSKPGTNKMWQAVDATVEGEWEIRASFNYDLPDAEEALGWVDRPTWNNGRFGMTGYSSHISVRMYNNAPGPATLANMAIHYTQADDEA